MSKKEQEVGQSLADWLKVVINFSGLVNRPFGGAGQTVGDCCGSLLGRVLLGSWCGWMYLAGCV